MKKKSLFIFLFLFSNSAHASTDNALKCEYDEFYKTGCHIENITLSENDPFQMDYLIKYQYSCEGHSFEVGAETETGFYSFQRGNQEQTLTATGQSRVFIKALNPEKLYQKILQKNCVVQVLGFNRKPSIQTLMQWNQNAKFEVTLLYSMLDSYNLAKNLDEIDAWDSEKLFLLKSNIQKLVNLYPLNLHFKAILHTIDSAIKNRPPKISIPTDSKVELRTYYKIKLENEMLNAESILKLFNQWKVELATDLAQVLENIKNQVK